MGHGQSSCCLPLGALGGGARGFGRSATLAAPDEVPTRSNPRAGCWASPAPAPSPVGTWSRKASADSTTMEATPRESFSLEGAEAGEGRVAFDIAIHEAQIDGGLRVPRTRVSEAVGIDVYEGAASSGSAVAPAPSGGARRGKIGDGDFRLAQLLSPNGLPPPMSQEDRARATHDKVERAIGRFTPGMSVNEKMGATPRRLLVLRGPDGQRMRRAVIRGSTIVFFTAGYEGKRFVYERAHALGVKSIVLESPDSWAKGLLDSGTISKFVPIDMSRSPQEVYEQALAAIKQLRQDPSIGEIDGVATVVELSVPIVARLTEALGLPGHEPEVVDRARDKGLTRAALKKAGLPTPPYCVIGCEADLARAAREVGFPAVLKPRAGAASLGVKKVGSERELLATFREVSQELSSLIVESGALVKDSGAGKGVKADVAIDTSLLLERYLDGQEVDVDIVMSEGDWKYAAVSDNGPTLEPYFNETWAVTPSLLPRDKQVALKELAIGSVKALGFADGVFHVECKYTSVGPHLIEVNARMGGGPVYATNLRTWNVCLVEETLFCAVGIPCRPDVPPEPKECVANSDVNALRSGILRDLKFLEPLRGREGVVSVDPHVRVGDEVCGPSDGLPTWLVEVVVSRPTPREALDLLLQLEKEVQALVALS